ncbi:MAG TPA: type III-B CRISPR module-associated protein Cmr5, partial [Methylomirabilota bacterium]|nr:type III-B CRISPR module-associated protein Cmr5 [Methylomirabilota bacterium]
GQPETLRQNIEQRRGNQAWRAVLEIKNFSEGVKKLLGIEQDEKQKKNYEKQLKEYDKLQKEYRSLARGLNAMIQINGLGQTLGFFNAKGKQDNQKAHFHLLKHLTQWMRDNFKASNIQVMNEGHDGLLKWITYYDTTSADYRRATTECLAFGNWLSRFAEAELKDPETSDTESTQPQGENS